MEQLVIKIAGIGQVTSVILTKHGFKTVSDVANASIESLSVVPGFANARSLQTIQRAKALLQTENV
ncbi:MAG: helix-hairpin-helix domain-containing protein, partial [Colwellia sp.]|nr:helix-hairpin-helix domain-containing protein [Colwellia sp.]